MIFFDYRTQYHLYRQYIDLLKKKIKTPVAQVSLAIVGSLLFVAFLIATAIRPTVVTIAKLLRDIKDEQQVMSLLDRKISSLQIAQRKLEESQGRLPVADRALPSTIDLSDVVRRLESLAHEKGIVMIEFSEDQEIPFVQSTKTPTPGAQLVRVYSIPIKMTLGGSETAIREFLASLEQLERLGFIRSVQINAVPIENKKLQPFPLYSAVSLEFYTTQSLKGAGPQPEKKETLPEPAL